jgi:phosphotriesterase-related protein
MGIPWRHDSTEQLDESMARLMCEVADRGFLSQMTITYDRWFFNPRGPATDENPQLLNEKVGLGYLFESFAPRLEQKGFRMRDLETLLVDNPRRILAF